MKNLTAKHVMNPNVLVAESDWSVNHLAEFFMENCISGAPVQSNAGIPIGVVSLTDIVHHETQAAGGWQGPHDYYLHALERQYGNRGEGVAFQIEAEPDLRMRDMIELEMLRQLNFFKDMNENHLKKLQPKCELVEFQKGDKLFTEGDDAAHLWVVLN